MQDEEGERQKCSRGKRKRKGHNLSDGTRKRIAVEANLEGREVSTERGIVVGYVQVSEDTKPCGIVVGHRLEWLWISKLLGYRATVVVMRRQMSAQTLQLIAALWGSVMVKVMEDHLELPKVETWFIDGYVDLALGAYMGAIAKVIISTGQRRGMSGQGWSLAHTTVAHRDVGGVTDGVERCFLWMKTDSTGTVTTVKVPALPRRDVYSVASDTVGGTMAEAPDPLRLDTPTVTVLGKGYHGGGLYPLNQRRPLFRLRCVYHPTRWCTRPLTWGETASVYDVPLDVVSALGGGQALEVVCVRPGKGLEHGSRALLRHGGLHCSGIWTTGIVRESHADKARLPAPVDVVGPFGVIVDDGALSGQMTAGLRDAKATKDDDAETPVWLWDRAILEGLSFSPPSEEDSLGTADALNALRRLGLNFFRRAVLRGFLSYVKKLHGSKLATMTVVRALEISPHTRYSWTVTGRSNYRVWWQKHWGGFRLDAEAGLDAVTRAADSSWWDWDLGSAPFYWRWPEEYRVTIRDGLDIWMTGPAPRFLRPQRAAPDPATREKMVDKLDKVRMRKYIAPHRVLSLTDFFHVPKGPTDIRLVYNGTSSGLNDVLWVPSFPLPTVNGLLRCVHPGSWMADTDLGEMFLNFPLHKNLRELAGVDLTHFTGTGVEPNTPTKTVWEAWMRCAMGLKPSPYQTTQGMQYVEDVVRGDRHDAHNIFRWDHVQTNLPGSPRYNPAFPWVYKVRADNTPACDFLFYVDDNRTVGNSKAEAWEAARRVACICNHLGIQDAPRKRREPSQIPGAWAGVMVSTDELGVYVATSQEKWNKAKEMIASLKLQVGCNPKRLVRKELEQKRGFLLYVTRSYPATVPYLKGLHLTIDGWRQGRDEEGWRCMDREAREVEESGDHPESAPGDGPILVVAKPRLVQDLEALTLLFHHERPPLRRVRSSTVVEVYYGFGDASQDGFGFTMQEQTSDRVHYRFGQWCNDVSEATSNYRELVNLVDRLETMVRKEKLMGSEVYLFTDNSTAEAVYYKGNSSSPKLFELIVRLRQLEMEGGLILHVIHVAGTRMIDEGTDGVSRGDGSSGVMSGRGLLQYVPLHLGALEAVPALLGWFNGWWDHERGPLHVLTPNDWYDRPFRGGNCLWAPAPAAAEAAVEQLGRIVHQHPYSCHLFVIPRLMTSSWRRKIAKIMDFECQLGAGASVWPKTQHEPLLIFSCLPLSRKRPWKLRVAPFVERLGGELCKVHSTHSGARGRILRKLFITARKVDSLPEGVVRGMLYGPLGLPLSNQDRPGRRRVRSNIGRR
jgi:hypothetical protein